MNRLRSGIVKQFVYSALVLLFSCRASALPSIDHVAHGDVTLNPETSTSLQINQTTNQAILNWHDFNIAAGEKVHFQQPANAMCLNRIDASNGMSAIAGELSATSKIILINNAGIVFTDTAQVNVGGIIASAVDVADANFLHGSKLKFDRFTNAPGAIINRGTINVQDNGLVALLGGSVTNDGAIVAKYSQIVLESGNGFALDFLGNGVINFAMDAEMPQPTAGLVLDENGQALQNGVNVSGKIINDGGDVVIVAAAVSGVFDNLINMSGEIRAQRISKTTNGVMLIGDGTGAVNVTGKIDVSGVGNDVAGGSIVAVSDAVNISDTAELDMSGGAVGGWLGLGDSHGHVKTFTMDSPKASYSINNKSNKEDSVVASITTGLALKQFNDYKQNTAFTAPIATIKISNVDGSDTARAVSIDISYNDTNLNFRSMKPEDHVLVHEFLNSQPLVRAKYANGEIVSAEYTEKRIEVLSDRFNADVADGCFMHGGFIVTDKDTGEFLGMVNSGTSLQAGITEIAGLYRADSWSHKPGNLYADYNLPQDQFLHKDYQGLATATVAALVQYTEALKADNYKIKGEEMTAIRAGSRIDNPGAWKALAKNEFDLKSVRLGDYGVDIRYRTEYDLK